MTVLDVCCGGRQFWFDKTDARALFIDNRTVETTLCDGRAFTVAPDMVADFRNLPFPDASFPLVVFDPPHLLQAGESSWLKTKYGVLGQNWREDIRKGFAECFRVLMPLGTLVFKWCEEQVSFREVLGLTAEKPLFGNRRGKTIWIVFQKEGME
jgi:ubiquinone/menaquinone biosynthesis C-methylase UbiE